MIYQPFMKCPVCGGKYTQEDAGSGIMSIEVCSGCGFEASEFVHDLEASIVGVPDEWSNQMSNQIEIINEILAELDRARAKFPTWPEDPIHAAGVIVEESGELMRATLQACYEKKKHDPSFAQIAEVRLEAIQTAAMAIRFLFSIDQYVFEAGHQHKQTAVSEEVSNE